MQKQHELLRRMVEQREQLRALQGRQKALMAMQESAEQVLAVIEDTGESAGQYRVTFVILRKWNRWRLKLQRNGPWLDLFMLVNCF